jgi:hypothetical protein
MQGDQTTTLVERTPKKLDFITYSIQDHCMDLSLLQTCQSIDTSPLGGPYS